MKKITYNNKQYVLNDPQYPVEETVTDADMNEIKEVVNFNADETLEENIKIKEQLERTQNALINITTEKSSNINVKDSSNLNAKIGVFGISEQETREGYNLLNVASTCEITGSKTVPISMPAGNYTIKADDITTDSEQTQFCFSFRDSSGTIADARISLSTKKITFALTREATSVNIYSGNSFSESQGVTTTYKNLMIYEGADDKTYEEYGASPSPEYPSDIENVTGNIDITICNKNLLDLTKCGFSNCVKNEDGSVRSNINNGYYAAITTSQLNDFILQNKGRSLTFSFEGISTKTIGFYIPCKRANSDSDYFETTKTGNSITMQIPEDLESLSYIQIRWNRQSTPFTDTTTVINNIQLELNDVKTDFIEHKEQLITFPLAEGQKLADGDYLASDGIHHVRDVYIFKAVTSLSIYNDNKYGTNVGAVNSINTSNILSDRIVASDSAKENTGYITGGGYTVVIYGNPTDTVESFNEKFVGAKIEYPLAKEKIEPYTPEQQEAYNKLQNVLSYYNVTNVFTDKAQLVFKYIADTQTWTVNLVKSEIANTNQQLLNLAGGN